MSEKEALTIARVFSTDVGKAALETLEKFARADEADFCEDPRKQDYMQGRRSVICEIRKALKYGK